MKLRAGKVPTRLQEAKYIFITTNATLALASKIYETKHLVENFFFIPSVVTDIFVGTITWMQSPAVATEINRKRLIANCYAALQPSRALVKTLTDTADRLRREGVFTQEDVVLLKQSRVGRNMLQEETLGDATRFTERTAVEILAEIRAVMRQEAEDKFKREREEFSVREQELVRQIENQKELARNLEGEHHQTKDELEKVKLEKHQIEKRIEALAGRIACVIKGLFIILALAAIIPVVIFQFFPEIARGNAVWKTILWVAAIALLLARLVTGFNIFGAGKAIERLGFKGAISILKGKD